MIKKKCNFKVDAQHLMRFLWGRPAHRRQFQGGVNIDIIVHIIQGKSPI